MITFEWFNWHAWEAQHGVLLSDESTKQLFKFASWDACINWAWFNVSRECSRAMNAAVKAKTLH